MYERAFVLRGLCGCSSALSSEICIKIWPIDVCLYNAFAIPVSVYSPIPKSCRIGLFELSDVWNALDSCVGTSLWSSGKSGRVCFLHATPRGQLLYHGQLGIGCGGLDWGKSWTLCAYCWIVTWHTWGQATKACLEPFKGQFCYCSPTHTSPVLACKHRDEKGSV